MQDIDLFVCIYKYDQKKAKLALRPSANTRREQAELFKQYSSDFKVNQGNLIFHIISRSWMDDFERYTNLSLADTMLQSQLHANEPSKKLDDHPGPINNPSQLNSLCIQNWNL